MGPGVKVGSGAIASTTGDFSTTGAGVSGVGLTIAGGVTALWFCFGDLLSFLGEEGGADGFASIFSTMAVGADCGPVDDVWPKSRLAIALSLAKSSAASRGDWAANALATTTPSRVMLAWTMYSPRSISSRSQHKLPWG